MSMAPARYRVASRTVETTDTVTLVLTPVDEPIERPLPGQFTMVYAFGVGEVPISVSGRTGTGDIGASPFETIDRTGIGRLVRMAVDEGRAAHPGLPIGVCGEHGGDPESVRFFHEVGLDYVSCSPFRVPVARLEAGRAAVPAKAE
jgi:hypothetical protein